MVRSVPDARAAASFWERRSLERRRDSSYVVADGSTDLNLGVVDAKGLGATTYKFPRYFWGGRRMIHGLRRGLRLRWRGGRAPHGESQGGKLEG